MRILFPDSLQAVLGLRWLIGSSQNCPAYREKKKQLCQQLHMLRENEREDQ